MSVTFDAVVAGSLARDRRPSEEGVATGVLATLLGKSGKGLGVLSCRGWVSGWGRVDVSPWRGGEVACPRKMVKETPETSAVR